MKTLEDFLAEGAKGDLLPWAVQAAAVERFQRSCRHVEETALGLGLLPARYQRNRKTISIEQQRTLLQSQVAVIGCGGLGGYVIEQLARLGVGTLVAVDPDVFEEHNLNRQILSSMAAIGRPKVLMAEERVAAINPAVTLVPLCDRFEASNVRPYLEKCQVVVDAVDTVSVRLAISDVCEQIGVPLVHGAIAGWYGQITTEYSGDRALRALYQHASGDRGEERSLGNPSFTPAVVASLQSVEVCKILIGVGTSLRHRVLTLDLLDMNFEEISLPH
ncbi:MAG TPA: HesA/MoeB/ThiF family protein [Telmatospirillum sp.]|nr:HesA/MoeB/ThiF family protein [Telmatospirillum sp.]